MNILQIIVDVIMVLVIAFLMFLGVKRGLAKSFFKSTKIVFVILLTLLIGSLVVSLCQSIFVNDMFEGKISDKLVARAEKDYENFGIEQIKDELPSFAKKMISSDTIDNEFSNLSGSNTEKARAIGEKIENTMISVVSNVVGYIIAFIISFILCTIGIFFVQKFFELPALNWLNRIGGIFWGAANAYLTTSFLAFLVALIFGNDFVNGTIITKAIHYFGLFTF